MMFPTGKGRDFMKFEEKLMALRKKAGMSQEELAEQLGVSRQAVSRWELGATQPDAPNLLKLSNLFCVTIDYLLRDECESEFDLLSSKNEMSSSAQKNRKLYLFATVSFLIAAVAFLIAAIDRMNIYLVLLVFADAILASVFFWKYCKTKE